ncbi:hypothetical protein [Ramlibacter humi]|uniref:Uncharacterized protein n=1 Tax=Ramlibacter humi TaxID=2530451 RepID=A0A4Z0CBG4_9BURK|nr:hypothetical protein [Ramlibacter humi]TFZ08943.1 hypothetical protein EZ216_07315 [Ramlibacter humi]
MSGPKVVRVVTREELVAAGTALLARLDAAVAQWTRDCGNLLKPADVEVTTKRRNELAAILAADRFGEFGQAAAKEIDFLEADASQRRERAAQARAMERMRQARGQELAKTLLRAGGNLAPQLRTELEKASAGQLSVAAMDTALSQARQALFQVAPEAATPAQNALAQRLGAAESESSFEAWSAKAAKPDVRLQSAFSQLEELDSLGFAAEAGTLEAQLRAAQALEEGATRDMRLDTLVLALRKAKDGALAKVKLLRQVELVRAELSAAAGQTEAMTKLGSASVHLSEEQLQALTELGREELGKAQAAAAAAARRKAVLDGLQRLGYQVQDGLSTLTPESGRLVVRRPSDSTYGVELVTGANQKVQVRTVAFEPGRDSSQDVAEEQRWCGDFGKLQADLKASGCEVVVERAMGVGTTAVRVIEAQQARSRDRGTQRPSAAS